MSSSVFKDSSIYRRVRLTALLAVFLCLVAGVWLADLPQPQLARSADIQPPSSVFRLGEKISYTVSLGKIGNAAYAETFVASRGTLSGKDAVEIRGRVKTLEMVSAAFYQVDESRTVYASPDTGLPLYVSTSSNNRIIPQEKVSNYLTQPTSSFELLTAIYKAREAGGAGTFPVLENDVQSTVTFTPTVSERVKTSIGDFETVISTVQAPFLAEMGIKEMKINFTTDEARVPVQIRFKTDRGPFTAIATAIVFPEAQTATPTPTPIIAETPPPTPRPSPTPEQYVDNKPLVPELGFQIGEILEYQISARGKPVARISFNVQERKLFQNQDSLLLTATITSAEPGNGIYFLGDSARAQVDPETLAPIWAEMKFNSEMSGLKQTVIFDKLTGMISRGPQHKVDSPIGTHNLLSLFYAMRSFNLRPSRDRSNPVNDTRVAVFWDDKTHVFTLRPSNPAELTVNGEKVSAQLITVNTSVEQLDAMAVKVWLRTDDRVPVRMTAGPYEAELIARSYMRAR